MSDVTGKSKILVVDDEPQIHRILRPSLTAAGFSAEFASSAAEALRLVAAGAPDLVILDLGLPDRDGKDVIKELRQWSKVPIIVLSARDRETEKIEALDLGANDYVNKPFGIGELTARIRVALRHAGVPATASPVLSAGSLVVDTGAHSVALDGRPVHLTPKEFDLLVLLMRHGGRILTHRQILTAVWGPAHAEDTQYLRVYIGQLRAKLEDDPREPRLIQSDPGVGYRLTTD